MDEGENRRHHQEQDEPSTHSDSNIALDSSRAHRPTRKQQQQQTKDKQKKQVGTKSSTKQRKEKKSSKNSKRKSSQKQQGELTTNDNNTRHGGGGDADNGYGDAPSYRSSSSSSSENVSEDSDMRPGVYQVRGMNNNLDTDSSDDGIIVGDDDDNTATIDRSSRAQETTSSATEEEGSILPQAKVFGEDDMEAEFNRRMIDRAVVAQAVVETEDDKSLFERYHYPLMGCSCLSVILGVILVVLFRNGGPLNDNDKNLPTSQPTIDKFGYLQDLVTPYSSPDKVYNSSSAQYAALEWLIDNHRNNGESELLEESSSGAVPFNIFNISTELLLERYALAVLYLETGGENWNINYGFLSNNTNVCDWTMERSGLIFGTQCDPTGHVTTLWLDANNLVGTVPPELAALESLTLISLGTNGLYGTIPTEIGLLGRLNFLRIDTNFLTGTLPQALEGLINLENIYLMDNDLTGTIPAGLLSNTNLQSVLMYKNRLTGTLPDFAARGRLDALQLEFNMLSGTIPLSMYTLNQLETAVLHHNLLTGTISTEIGKLTDLQSFEIQDNEFIGTIPTEIGRFQSLRKIEIYQNQFTGTIPSALGSIRNLVHVDLSSNHLTGTLPTEIAELSNLKEFHAHSNRLTGSVPETFGTLENIERFAIGLNDITDGIDTAFCTGPITSTLFPEVQADCGGDSPKVSCSCCTSCCDSDMGNCTSNREAICNLNAARLQVEGGKHYEAGRGRICECVDDNKRVSCRDTTCESCNIAGTVCGRSYDYGMVFDDNGKTIGWTHSIEYTKGRTGNATYSEVWPYKCEAIVGGKKCQYCQFQECFDLFRGVGVDCSNIEMPEEGDGDYYTHCGSYSKGPMEALTMVFLYSGCQVPYFGFESNGLLEI